MTEKETTSLDDLMEGASPRSTVIDVTKGKVEPPKAEEEKVEAKPELGKQVVQHESTGPVDFSNMEAINPSEILPPKVGENPHEFEDKLMSELDMAVDRTCKRVSENAAKIMELQEEDKRMIEEAKELEELKKQDRFALEGVEENETNDESYTSYKPDYSVDRKHVSISDDFDIEDMIDTPEVKADKEVDKEVKEEEPVKEEKKIEEVKTEPVEEPTPAKEEVEEKKEAPVHTSTNILEGVDDKDLFDDEFDDEEDDEDPSTDPDEEDKAFENLKEEVKTKITPIRKTIDLSKFTIAKKSMNAQKVMQLAVKSHQNVADWVLLSQGRPISLTGLSGAEILKLNPESSNRNRLNTFRDMYRIIYDHIYDANKPEFETWMKQTHFIDVQHIYFGLYMATFSGSNFLTYSCTNDKCNKIFIKDVKFEDMVNYKDDKVKERVKSILAMDTTTPSNKDAYDVDLVQISDSYVFGLKEPSIWNVIMETASLSDKFLEKHADFIDLVSYIDAIYVIDEANNNLIQVDTKPDPNNQSVTSARRIKAFYDIISTLSSEDFYNLRAKINEYDKSSTDITYQIPAAICPDCGTEIPVNREIAPDNMLFTRHQLAAIGNM